MTTVALSFDSIPELVEIIKVLKTIGKTLDYTNGSLWSLWFTDFSQDLIRENKDNFEYVLNDMLKYNPNIIDRFRFVKGKDDDYIPTETMIQNVKLIYAIKLQRRYDNLYLSDILYEYKKYKLPEMIDLIILNLQGFDNDDFDPDVSQGLQKQISKLEKYGIFKGIVQRINRDDFYEKVNILNVLQTHKDEWMKAYDKAAKERAVDVSIGLGYAQFDNQEHLIIPSLVLQEIVNQSVDLSGMPAWQVYQIVKHINEGTTDKTVRLGVPSNFEDARDN
jgi:hypothetical protein